MNASWLHKWKQYDWLLLFALIIFYFFYFALPLITLGTENLRVVEAFNTDESDFLWPLIQAAQAGRFHIGLDCYGHLYYNTGLLIAHFTSLFTPLNGEKLILIFRSLSFLFFSGTVVTVYLTGRKFISRAGAWISVLLFLSGFSTLLNYSTMLHPDTAQLFFIFLGILFCGNFLTSFKFRHLTVAAIAAGMAFSSKFGGVLFLLLPISLFLFFPKRFWTKFPEALKLTTIILIAGISWYYLDPAKIGPHITGSSPIKTEVLGYLGILHYFSLLLIIAGVLLYAFQLIIPLKNLLQMMQEKIVGLLLLGALFWCAFALTSPAMLWDYRFIDGFIDVTALSATGGWFTDPSGVSGWLNLLFSEKGAGIIIPITGIASLLFLLNGHSPRLLKSFTLLLWCWSILYFGVILWKVQSKFAHYLLPLFPAAVMLYAIVAEQLTIYLKVKSGTLKQFTAAIPVGLTGLFILFSAFQLKGYQKSRITAVQHSAALKAGHWLESNVNEKVKILADKYTYIPSAGNIEHVKTWALTDSLLQHYFPDLLVIHKKIFQHYRDSGKATLYNKGENAYLERYRIYTSLINDRHSDFQILQDFGNVKIYRRKEASYQYHYQQLSEQFMNVVTKWNDQFSDSLTVLIMHPGTKLKTSFTANTSLLNTTEALETTIDTIEDSAIALAHFEPEQSVLFQLLAGKKYPKKVSTVTFPGAEIFYLQKESATKVNTFSSACDFESPSEHWKVKEKHLQAMPSGTIEVLPEHSKYSTIFTATWQAMNPDVQQPMLLAMARVKAGTTLKNTALTLSIEREGKVILWKSTPLAGITESHPDTWASAYLATSPPADIRPNDKIKVVIWKRDQALLHIASMKVECLPQP